MRKRARGGEKQNRNELCRGLSMNDVYVCVCLQRGEGDGYIYVYTEMRIANIIWIRLGETEVRIPNQVMRAVSWSWFGNELDRKSGFLN